MTLRDVLCRVVSARDLMEDGDVRLAELVLHYLELDIAIAVEQDEHRRAA